MSRGLNSVFLMPLLTRELKGGAAIYFSVFWRSNG